MTGNMDVDPQLVSPVPHEVRILEERAADEDGVDPPVRHHLGRQLGAGDAAHGADLHAARLVGDGLPYLLGQRELVARRGADLLPRVEPAAADVEEVDPPGGEHLGQLHAVVERPLGLRREVLQVVGPRDAREEGVVGGDGGTGELCQLEEEAGAVLEGPAVGVGAVIRGGREERVDEVAVGGVELDRLWSRDGRC